MSRRDACPAGRKHGGLRHEDAGRNRQDVSATSADVVGAAREAAHVGKPRTRQTANVSAGAGNQRG